MQLPSSRYSIARLTSNGRFTGTGFFADTKEHGPVCVTCSHVYHRNGGVLEINSEPTRLRFDASAEVHPAIDIALLEIPKALHDSGQIFHQRIAVSRAAGRIYYTHAWAPMNRFPDRQVFATIYGPRIDRKEQMLPGLGSLYHWELRNDVKSRSHTFSADLFRPGWSGAPVFAESRKPADHSVVGIVAVADEGPGQWGLAISTEGLTFLEPAEEARDEARMVRRAKSSWLERLLRKGKDEDLVKIYSDDGLPAQGELTLWERRYEEIMDLRLYPTIEAPPASIYDSISP